MGYFVRRLTPLALATAMIFINAPMASAQTTAANASVSEEAKRLTGEAMVAFKAGDYGRGERAAAQAVELIRQSGNDNSVEFSSALSARAINLDALGRSAEAEPLLRRALSLRTDVLGEKHPYAIASINNLALNLDALGRSAEAPHNDRGTQ